MPQFHILVPRINPRIKTARSQKYVSPDRAVEPANAVRVEPLGRHAIRGHKGLHILPVSRVSYLSQEVLRPGVRRPRVDVNRPANYQKLSGSALSLVMAPVLRDPVRRRRRVIV